ncbi:DNA translocase FtsK [Bacillus pseudomycoides]|uniref:DNA translocase FtsK n=1 Tax=Bacillus pseudomycoides TaxID=64104 RepID=UPI000BEC5088|nr:DNA translocase FtsK [Bacillus pseudomycoides]PEF24396.1 cell division protein FtsK [Bacillus pseudomycoides]PGD74560.1 cell division protein FtsK [Bacillus pseudomycoides]
MLDWMKKLFNKEEHQEEKAAINKAVPKNTESKPKTPRVNHYTEAREAQMASRNLGVKCRFPLIPDDGFDEENVEESTHFEQQPLPRVTNMERRRPRYVEEPVHTFAPPQAQQEIEPEPILPKKSVPVQESHRRPFRPTEMISPIFGYKRPSREKQEVKTEEKGQEDLEISFEGKSVVDAWLEKKGYSLSNFSDESFIPSKKQEKNLEHTGQQESPKEEKSVVDQWLEKNGYDSERSLTSLEGQEKVDAISDSLPFATDNFLHKSVGQDNKKEEHTVEIVQVFEKEPDVVALSQYDNEAKEEILQDELLDSTVENMDTTSTEENEYKKEIEEEQLVEKTILEENIVEEVEEAEEPTREVGAVEEAEEPTREVEEVEEPEETLVAETFEEAKIAETAKESAEETAQVVVEKTTEQENLVSKAENNVSETSSAVDEHTKEAVQNFANVLIEEAEEKQEVAVEQPDKQKEEPKREKKRHVPFNVVMLKQDRRKLIERHVAGMKTPQTPIKQAEEPVKVHEQPVQQVEEAPQGKAQTAQQIIVETQVEKKPVEQVIVETREEERPAQQVVVGTQEEEKPVERVAVENQVTEEPVQQTEMKAPVASAGVQEKAYVIARRENDMRNVLQTPPEYAMPPLTLLTIPSQSTLDNTEWLEEQKELLDTTFNNFHVGAHVINVSQGPAVTRFEVQPDPGVKVNKITNLSDDIKLSLAAKDIRIEAPIPGKSAIGIEVPNKESKPVFLREILRSPVFTKSESPLTVALGLDISGAPIVTDIRKMPHGLIAGATGSGKSVCINAILTSILYKAKPHEVKLMLIDPKMVELAPYNSIPHLVAPVITDVKAATAALKWAVEEMERRYELFAHVGARDLTRYNTIVSSREIPGEALPYIVIVIDELADLMMVAPGDVEEAICRIAQKARACGIHLLVATQRPSVDVITGLIKSNIPTRIAFTVSSQVDSRTIIDIGGAEKLLGRGDMLFLGNGTSKPVRVQGVYVSDDEIEKTVEHVKKQMKSNYLFKQEDLLAKTEQHEAEDELFFDACQFVVEQGGASTSSVQRKFRIGYNRAARLIEEMEAQGIISEARGTKPRDVLISEDEFAAMQETNV